MSMLVEQMGLQIDKVDRIAYPISQALKALGYESRRVRRPGPDGRSVNAKFWDRVGTGVEHIFEHNKNTSGPN